LKVVDFEGLIVVGVGGVGWFCFLLKGILEGVYVVYIAVKMDASDESGDNADEALEQK